MGRKRKLSYFFGSDETTTEVVSTDPVRAEVSDPASPVKVIEEAQEVDMDITESNNNPLLGLIGYIPDEEEGHQEKDELEEHVCVEEEEAQTVRATNTASPSISQTDSLTAPVVKGSRFKALFQEALVVATNIELEEGEVEESCNEQLEKSMENEGAEVEKALDSVEESAKGLLKEVKEDDDSGSNEASGNPLLGLIGYMPEDDGNLGEQASAIPAPWQALTDEETQAIYYWNPTTNEVQWERPCISLPASPTKSTLKPKSSEVLAHSTLELENESSEKEDVKMVEEKLSLTSSQDIPFVIPKGNDDNSRKVYEFDAAEHTSMPTAESLKILSLSRKMKEALLILNCPFPEKVNRLLISLEVRLSDWKEGGLKDDFVLKKITEMIKELEVLSSFGEETKRTILLCVKGDMEVAPMQKVLDTFRAIYTGEVKVRNLKQGYYALSFPSVECMVSVFKDATGDKDSSVNSWNPFVLNENIYLRLFMEGDPVQIFDVASLSMPAVEPLAVHAVEPLAIPHKMDGDEDVEYLHEDDDAESSVRLPHVNMIQKPKTKIKSKKVLELISKWSSAEEKEMEEKEMEKEKGDGWFLHQLRTGEAYNNPNLIPLGNRISEPDADLAVAVASSAKVVPGKVNETVSEKSSIMTSWRQKALLQKMKKMASTS
jgi:hypothetical protein